MLMLLCGAAGFPHLVHEERMFTAGKDKLACESCHSGTKKPTHATCFGCHDFKKETALCDTCHVSKTKVFYPPYAIDPDYRVELGHQAHAATTCARCHDAKPAAPHARCKSCHETEKKCSFCHIAATGDPAPPRLKPPVYAMTSFRHDKHDKNCTQCHAAIAQSNDQFLPRPDAKSCASCHDIAQKCTLCHTTSGPIEKVKVLRFRHATHDQAPCASCHRVQGNEVVSVGHAACTGCHAEDFGSRTPRVCMACHTSIEPWRKLIVDRLPPPSTEFGAALDHGKHPQPCAQCHTLTTQTHELRPPRGHLACSSCHAKELANCAMCHTAGVQAERDITRRGAAWSVRERFTHRTHTGACADCHKDPMTPPAKASCAPCHDGKSAFALTGTTCTRCHVGL